MEPWLLLDGAKVKVLVVRRGGAEDEAEAEAEDDEAALLVEEAPDIVVVAEELPVNFAGEDEPVAELELPPNFALLEGAALVTGGLLKDPKKLLLLLLLDIVAGLEEENDPVKLPGTTEPEPEALIDTVGFALDDEALIVALLGL